MYGWSVFIICLFLDIVIFVYLIVVYFKVVVKIMFCVIFFSFYIKKIIYKSGIW